MPDVVCATATCSSALVVFHGHFSAIGQPLSTKIASVCSFSGTPVAVADQSYLAGDSCMCKCYHF